MAKEQDKPGDLEPIVNKVVRLVKDIEKKKKFRKRLLEAKQLDDKRIEALYESIIRALEDEKLLNRKIKPDGKNWEWVHLQGTILNEFINKFKIPKSIKGDDDKSRKRRQQIREQIRTRIKDGYWRKTLPFSPSIWADYYFDLSDSVYAFVEPAPKPEPKDEFERLLSEYVVLGYMHDTILDPPACDRLQDISEESHEYNVNLYCVTRLDDNRSAEYLEKRKGRIDTAVEHVEADLASGTHIDKKATGTGREQPPEEEIEAVTLIQFMQQYCKGPLKESVLTSRKTSLYKANGKGIQLPENIGEWTSGRPLWYNPVELKTNWPQYRDRLPNLPPLKQARQ